MQFPRIVLQLAILGVLLCTVLLFALLHMKDSGIRMSVVIEDYIEGSSQFRCYAINNSENITFNWMRNDNLPVPRDHYITIRKYACISMLNGREVFRVIAYRNVTEPLRIKLNLNRQVVRPGDDALITCEATGEQPITITWERLRDPIPRSVQTYGGRMQFQNISVWDAGTYMCRATNKDGATDATADVIVEDD